jgi:hypothetical protein
MVDRHPQFDEILDSNVSQILTEIDRLSEIARAFSRYGAPAHATGPLVPVDAPAVIREALTLYRSGDRSIRYIDDVQPDLPRVHARADELKEVILNLVENARAALDGAGDIIISAYAIDGGRVEIEVADRDRASRRICCRASSSRIFSTTLIRNRARSRYRAASRRIVGRHRHGRERQRHRVHGRERGTEALLPPHSGGSAMHVVHDGRQRVRIARVDDDERHDLPAPHACRPRAPDRGWSGSRYR